MPNASRYAVASLLLLAASWFPAQPATRATRATPPRGPGAVIEAIEGFLRAADEQDAARLEKTFQPRPANSGAVYLPDPKSGELTFQATARQTPYLQFADIAADGKPILCTDAATAIAAVRTQIGGAERELAHRILSIHADCPSGDCSWGSVTFERTFRRDGQRICQPMRALVLVQHQSEPPHMRIFHWHAAPAGPEQLRKG